MSLLREGRRKRGFEKRRTREKNYARRKLTLSRLYASLKPVPLYVLRRENSKVVPPLRRRWREGEGVYMDGSVELALLCY